MGARVGLLIVSIAIAAAPVFAAEHPALARARMLYNAGDFDGAIASASMARADAPSADAAALVLGRSHLERFRLRSDTADLAAAREALSAVRAPALTPRDQLDLLVGLGQSLFLGENFGASAELFDTALTRAALLPERDRWLLLEWWATSLEKEAQRRPGDRRQAMFERIVSRMEDELRADPGNGPANYWLPLAARGAGEVERAWHAAMAGWIRAGLRPDHAAAVRADLDRLVTQALIPERVRGRPAREQQETTASLRAEWDALKAQWN
ncbi:MAG: hypothetical protein FJW14_01870 [Acidimicrobiia bacterium]|nr:hypothetical protein [Acidimicrobiia bacterium]